MALTTDFPGTSLPDGWAALTPSGSTVTVADGWLQLAPAGGTSYDTIFANSGVNGAICAYHAVPDHGGPISWAVQLSTDVGDTKSWGYSLLACDVDGEDNSGGAWARYGVFHTNTNDERPNRFAASRPPGSGTGAGGTNHLNTNVGSLGLQSGTPAYLRLDFDGVQTWQPYVSTDGHTWIPDTQFTRAITPTRLLIAVTSTNPNTAGTLYVAGSWDLLALGTTDLREPLPAVSRATVSSFDGTASELPAGWVDDSAGGDSVTFTGTAVRLSSDAANVESRARIIWSGDRYQSCGLLLRVNWPSFDGDLFNTWALQTDEGSSQDPYLRVGGGYGCERGNTAIRPIRIDDPTGSNVASVPGSTGLDEKPYAWLADLTGDPLNTGSPTWMIRLERQYVADGGHARYRVKFWPDEGDLASSLAAEPSTWDVMDAQDDIERRDLGPLLVLAHNNPVGGLTGTGQQDILHAEFYELVELVPAIAGTASVAAAGSGALSVSRGLAGAATAAAASAGALSASRALAGTATAATDATGALSKLRRLAGTGAFAALAVGTVSRLRGLVGPSPVSGSGAGALSISRVLNPRVVAASPVTERYRAEPVRSAVSSTRISSASVEQLHHRLTTPTEPSAFAIEHTFVAGNDVTGATWADGEWADDATQQSDGDWVTTAITPAVGPSTAFDLDPGEWLCFARIGGPGGVVKYAGSILVT